MKKSTLLYGAGLVAYMLLSKSLKNKESNLSKCVNNAAEKLSCFLKKYSEPKSSDSKLSESHS